jgi:hypothetical protein
MGRARQGVPSSGRADEARQLFVRFVRLYLFSLSLDQNNDDDDEFFQSFRLELKS